ncbi:MAG: ABC transporter permease [Nitratireductor sp.]|nr:ABC transporter permease [Nitratireductor sp.]
MAYYAATRNNALSKTLLVLTGMVFWLSFVVRTYVWVVLLGSSGPIVAMFKSIGFDPAPRLLYTSFASNIGLTHIMLPYMILSLYAVMKNIDPSLSRAAAGLGASPFRSFALIFLPLSLPGIANGCLLCIIFCLGFYVTPELLGSPSDRMIAGMISVELLELLDWQRAAAMAVILLVLTVALLVVYDRFLGIDRIWR